MCIFNCSGGGGAFSFNMLLSFVGDGFCSTILQRLRLRGGQGGSYTDIYDGNLYQQQVAAGFLAEKKTSQLYSILMEFRVPVIKICILANLPVD